MNGHEHRQVKTAMRQVSPVFRTNLPYLCCRIHLMHPYPFGVDFEVRPTAGKEILDRLRDEDAWQCAPQPIGL